MSDYSRPRLYFDGYFSSSTAYLHMRERLKSVTQVCLFLLVGILATQTPLDQQEHNNRLFAQLQLIIVEKMHKDLLLDSSYPALVIFDVSSASALLLLANAERSHLYTTIPSNCTDRLQPLYLSMKTRL